MSASFHIKEQIRQSVDLIELAGSYFELRPAGRVFKALCPWHNDTKPSLTFNPERQSYKCWVCNEGGDIFSLVMKLEGVSFGQAMRLLAERAGIRLENEQSGGFAESAEAADEKSQLFRVAAWAEERFHQCLVANPLAEEARSYLADRGITPESVQRFRLGFAPNQSEWLREAARRDKVSVARLEALGLVATSQFGKQYERFRGRVLFPIHDMQARSVALGGRILPSLSEQSPAKYVNSPESPLFSKSRLLYGLHLARSAMHRSRTAVVVEGYTDCLIAHQFGVDHAVAVLGTALTESHLRLLRRFADRVVLVLDGDEAGQRRSNDLLSLFVAEQLDLRVLTLPDGLDPADFLLSRGAESFRQALSEAPDALEHKFRQAARDIDPRTDTYQVAEAVSEILTILAKAPVLNERTTTETETKRQQILHRLSRHFFLPEDELRLQLGELRRREQKRPGTRVAQSEEPNRIETIPSSVRPQPWESELVELLLDRPEVLENVRQQVGIDQFRDPELRMIYQIMADLADDGHEPSFQAMSLAVEDPDLKRRLVDLDETARHKATLDFNSRLSGTLERAQAEEERARWQQTRRQMEGNELDEQAQLQALSRLISRKRQTRI